MKNVTFRMIRDGEVSGSVRDSHGNPIAGMQVSLMHQVYSRTGQLGRATEGTAVTDDRGEYRVFWVPPGSYLVSVGAAPSASLASPNISVVPDFPTTFYPGTIEAQHASVIEVAPGVDLPDVDIVMTQPAAYSIRGKVIDIGGGLPPAGFAVSLSQRIDAGSSLAWTLSAPKYSITTNPATGDFEIRGVIPGSYWLRASTLVCGDCLLDLPDDPADLLRYLTELANLRLESPPPGSLPSAEMSLDVNGSDIENIGLTLIPNVSIPIKFSLDGRDISSLIGVDQMRVALFPTASGAGIIDGNLTRARGFTSVYGVAPGEYRLGLRWTLSEQPDLFVKEARFGGKDILDQPFAVTNSSRETLNIVLSDKGSQLEGTLVDSLSNPRSDIPVVLIPDQNRDRPELYKDATTDKKGHFSFRGIAPGAYKVFAWEALESFSYWNKDVLSRYESQGKAVNITEGSRQTVDVKIISATK
jgi:hypothetical protein